MFYDVHDLENYFFYLNAVRIELPNFHELTSFTLAIRSLEYILLSAFSETDKNVVGA